MAERSEASRQNITYFYFWREASLRAFIYASLSQFSEINVYSRAG